MKLGVVRYGLLAAAAAALAAAQTPLPAGGSLLDKYIEATGGRAVHQKVKTMIETATMEMASAGLKFQVTTYHAAPNKSYMVMEIPGVGKMEEGTDGDIVWSLSAMQGPRIKQGEERSFALLSAAYDSDLNWKGYYKSAETTGVEDVEGEPCYKVDLTSNEGLKQTRYYSTKSGLMRKTAMTMKTEMGDIPTETIVSDYRDESGLLVPHKVVTKLMSQQMVMNIERVELNPEIDASRFAPPAEIKALLEKSKAK
jgi:outer membrane lipoprotein-sorting protein